MFLWPSVTCGKILVSKGPFTVIVSANDCNVASKWVPLISVALFTLNDAKHQRKKMQMQMQSLTVNGLLNDSLLKTICQMPQKKQLQIKTQKVSVNEP